MNHLPATKPVPYQRPTATTLRLKLLVSMNRLRRRMRRRATGPHSRLLTTHLS